jgi:hypothetical protein
MKYSIKRYDNLAFAIAHYGTDFHKMLFNFMVEANLTKPAIFSKFIAILKNTNSINQTILKEVK